MPPSRWRPVRDRPGMHAWLGPTSLCLGVLSWILLAGGLPLALAAVGCGVASIATSAEYRLDWTAVAGACAGLAQLLVSVMLLAMSASGY